jgi:hypothetical protein
MVERHLVAATAILRCYNPTVLNRLLLITVFVSPVVFGQQESTQLSLSRPQVKLNGQASEIMARYPEALELGSMLGADVSWLAGPDRSRAQGPEVTR